MMNNPDVILLTGVAGFVGYHTAKRLLDDGYRVVGVDNVNSYYDPKLKLGRLARLDGRNNFSFERGDVSDPEAMAQLFSETRPGYVIHLAAQAGVRHSLERPFEYTRANVDGFLSILEACRQHQVEHLVYASSSSVYGGNRKQPYCEHDPVEQPVSLYAATKRANELMAETYSRLHGIPASGLRFFTVYGPWGRPDMAYFLFTQAIFAGEPIRIFNGGDMERDFTFVDDIVEGLVRVMFRPPRRNGGAPHRVFNIGNSRPVRLGDFIAEIERCAGRTAIKDYWPMQPGDVVSTHASIDALAEHVGYRPTTSIEDGIRQFVDWYKYYYEIA